MRKTNRSKAKKVKAKAPVKKKKVTKKPAKKAASKKAPKAVKALKKSVARTKATMIAKSLPNPVQNTFLVTAPETETAARSFLDGGNGGEISESFTIDVTRAKLFESKDAAQGMIDGALILADESSPFHRAEIVPAKAYLRPHYRFELIEGEYMLSVAAVPKDDEMALTFSEAKAMVKKDLKEWTNALAAKTKAFQKAWG